MKVVYQPPSSEDYEVTYVKAPGIQSTTWASGYRKAMCVTLAIEAGEILPRCYDDMRQQYAFAITVRSLSYWLERYTSPGIRQWTRQHYSEMQDRINEIKDNKELSYPTIQRNQALTMFDYSLPVYYQALRIISHSKIITREVEGILDPSDVDLGKRVRGELPLRPLLTIEDTTNSDDTKGYTRDMAVYGNPDL